MVRYATYLRGVVSWDGLPESIIVAGWGRRNLGDFHVHLVVVVGGCNLSALSLSIYEMDDVMGLHYVCILVAGILLVQSKLPETFRLVFVHYLYSGLEWFPD